MEVNVLTDEQKQLFIDKSKQVYEKYEDVLGKDLIEKARKYNGDSDMKLLKWLNENFEKYILVASLLL